MVRVVEKRGKDCRLHYWFYPDSFDIWVSNLDAEESEKRDETFQGIWHVAANWILDTAEFNEWMNEEDYEIDEDLVGASSLASHSPVPCLLGKRSRTNQAEELRGRPTNALDGNHPSLSENNAEPLCLARAGSKEHGQSPAGHFCSDEQLEETLDHEQHHVQATQVNSNE